MQTETTGSDVSSRRAARLEPIREIAGRSLTRREQQIVQLVLRGETNRGIAAALGVSEHTIKGQLGRLYEKVGVMSRLELALKVLRR